MPIFLLAAALSLLLGTGFQSCGAPRIGCHLRSFSVTIKSDLRGSCRGTHSVQACVGYCESSAFPSKYSILLASNFKHNITSVKVQLRCGASRRETAELFTAKACQCDVCRLSRY
ncbi:hypothetical protein lerEdw1_002931 [Lerista edwardsae]|nr:hypothetical protein lerEdw1_002931 [Lerista edwardsae]